MVERLDTVNKLDASSKQPGKLPCLLNDLQKIKVNVFSRKFENAELENLVITGQDLRPYLENIYKSDLGCLSKLVTLKFERCQIEYFAPRELSETLRNISLEGNRIERIDVTFGEDDPSGLGNYFLENVKIQQLNLANNVLKEFPYDQIQRNMDSFFHKNKLEQLQY